MAKFDFNGALREFLSGDGTLGPLFVEISNPTCGTTGTVRPGYPGACTGNVDVNGTAKKSGFNLSYLEVSVNGGSPQYDWSPVFDQTTSEYAWSVENVSGAHCPCQGTTGQNTLVAKANWADPNGGMNWITEVATCPFEGDCSGAGGPIAAEGNGMVPPAVLTTADPSQLVEPTVCDDGWLEYRNLLASSSSQFGKLLAFNGRPLTASMIAVYAIDVNWYNNGHQAIRRAIGNVVTPSRGLQIGGVIFGQEPYRFHEAPKEAVCMFQPGGLSNFSQTQHCIISQSACSPDVFNVYADQPIATRINDNLSVRIPHTGSYSLRVKVLG